ncbi:Signal peptide, CUB and EGF-like domain-containing 1 [Paramuricea clavata]|uniref:Signal peptide, CUB and EGF-like domain-containing 1 n=1 Tax=Paramuricea clavata TaxID=317549 RepID=A0A6S7J8D8_PARCT|nr:Signal peptide, CUB and EGF-like domain-containing 1 [Paramuricea clavata]
MAAFEMRLFRAAILLFCCVIQHGQAADHTAVFGLCDVGDVISARNGSLVVSKGKDCTRVILAPRGWRIKFTLHEIDMFDAVAFIHDGGTVAGTLKYEQGIRVLLAGSKPIVFYTSSNALLVHTDRISSNGNKFNATFEVLPHPLDKCACLPTVNSARTVCSFPPYDDTGRFYQDNDELKKTCKTSCDTGHEIVEKYAFSSGVIDTTSTCNLHLDMPTSTWAPLPPDNAARLFNYPNLISCTKVKPVTRVLSVYTFTYANIPISCAELNMSVIENGAYNFLVSNRSSSYVGECYKDTLVNCTVRPVLSTCYMPSNRNIYVVKIEIRDNIQMAENETMTRKLFDILYGNVSANLKNNVQWYVTNDLLVNNATAIKFNPLGSDSVKPYTSCPANHATTGRGNNPGNFLQNCISCPLHTYKHFYAGHYYSACEQCPSKKRRLLNESMCVNGTKMYSKPSNVNCLHVCALGKFFNNDSGICDWCDYGYFQNSTTALNPVCHRCPPGNTTAFVGARSKNDCMHQCRKGQFTKFPSCFDCGIGYFMPYEGNRFPKCYKCPLGNTTLTVGTTNRTGCVDQCALGEYFNITQGMCVLCPINTYQNETAPSNTRSCKMCPTNRVMLSTGAISIELCLGPCSAGQYLNTTSRSCKLCPVNTYEDERRISFMCKKCPEHKITQNKGSTNISQCIYPCNEGEFFNLTSEACEMCPNNTYQNNIGKCSCKPCTGKMFTLKPGSKGCIAPCNRGEFLNKSAEACEDCPVGYFQNETNYLLPMCMACPLDYYTDKLGSHGCTACPERRITIVPAATVTSECIESCGRGYYLNKTLRSCGKCSKGFYQDQREYRNESCTKCAGANLTTLRSGAKAAGECVGYCASSPCLNGGKCTNLDNDFNCTCLEHLGGKQCQTILDYNNADRMEISVRFTNLVWNNNLSNPDTRDFMELANRIENAVRGDLRNDTTFRTVKVEKFIRGSVISDLTFNYVAGTDFNNSLDTLKRAAADGKIGNLTVNSSSFYIGHYTCGTPLGMENGRIPDSGITSANKDNYHPFSNARLNHNGPGWTPRVNRTEDAYLQVDFQEVVQLTGIATQGSSYQGGNWLQSCQFNYSVDGSTWLEYKEETNQPKFRSYTQKCENINC